MASILSSRVFQPLVKKEIHKIGSVYALSYSRKNNETDDSCYVEVKSNKNLNAKQKRKIDPHANWELLNPIGFQFILPGGVGPAVKSFGKQETNSLFVEVQQCPNILRDAVMELFYGDTRLKYHELNVITLRQRGRASIDHEAIAKRFIEAAEEICKGITKKGNWANFINPFSGRPHIGAMNNAKLYTTDQRFRCVGFEIDRRSGCTVIESKEKLRKFTLDDSDVTDAMTIAEFEQPIKFVGNLFTDASTNSQYLADILKKRYI